MAFDSRRGFLKRASAAGIAISAHHLWAPFVRAQTAGSASSIFRFDLDSRRVLPALDRNIFGSFLEHLGRAIYEGIYDPNSKFADANGFRKDVLEEIQKLQVPLSAIPAGISSRATTGWTAWAPGRIVPKCWIRPGTRLRPINSAPTSFFCGAGLSGRSRCSA